MRRDLQRERLIYRWDLDKTYLRTEFDTLRDLFLTAFETARDKRTVPGAATLLREIQASGPAGIYILSGSPEQMRRVLEAKLRLDGIRWDALTLKPNLTNLLRGRFRAMKDQVGFKLGAMLAAREPLAPELDEVLFGDDAETDAFVYSLYADLCSGQVGIDVLERVLAQAAVTDAQADALLARAARVPKRDICARIFIHLERVSSLERFEVYGGRVCPFYNYLQPAMVLVELGAMDAPAALRVAADLVIDQGFGAEALMASYEELLARGQVTRVGAERLLGALERTDERDLATAGRVVRAFGELLARLPSTVAATPPKHPALDYASLLAQERARVKEAKLRARLRG
jgi:hypothetical protein